MDVFPLAESVRWRGKLLPRYGWYMLSGAVCDVAQFLIYRLLWTSLGADMVAWTTAYLLSIALRQEMHKMFVFGRYEGSWYKNLWKFYCVYFATVATSSPVYFVLVRAAHQLPGEVLDLGVAAQTYAYFGTTIYTGIFSYVRLKANWRRPTSAMKLSKSGLDLGLLPTEAGRAASPFSKYQTAELSRRTHTVNPCRENPGPRHQRVPSYGSEYAKLLVI